MADVYERIVARGDALKRKFLLISAGVAAGSTVANIAGALASDEAEPALLVKLCCMLVVQVVTAIVALRAWRLASYIFVFGILLAAALSPLLASAPDPSTPFAIFIPIVLAGYLLGPSSVWLAGGVGAAIILLDPLRSTLFEDYVTTFVAPWPIALGTVAFVTVILALSSRQVLRTQQAIESTARSKAEQEQEILVVASHLGAATGEILAMMREQTEASLSQSSAVEETRHVLSTVSSASDEIVEAATLALDNAEVTYRNSEEVERNVATLSQHIREIGDLLEGIEEVSDKSDLLALNAALEGVRAGEAGEGFSIVAGQMQKLAESVAQSVRDVQALTAKIRAATTVTQSSMREAMTLANATTEAAHAISLITQQQRSGVAQVSTAMDDIVELTARVAAGTKQTISSAEDLQGLAEKLLALVRRDAEGASE